MRRVALATCAEVPELDEDGPGLIKALADRGIAGVPAVWDEPGADWTAFDLVVVRSTWDYAERLQVFLAWVHSLPRVLNPPEVLRWNTEKRYLGELEAAGVPAVPTQFLEPGQDFVPPGRPYVVKPAVSAGARHSARYGPGECVAGAHVAKLYSLGRTVMVQPYLDAIDEAGETALIYIGGSYSHAVRKAALLKPAQPPGEALYLAEDMSAASPTEAERSVADQALRALGSNKLLQARVDLIPTHEGPVVLEVELTEPSLYLGYADGATERFADAIADAL